VGRKVLPAVLVVLLLAAIATAVLLLQPWSRIKTVALVGGTSPAPPVTTVPVPPPTTMAAAPSTTLAAPPPATPPPSAPPVTQQAAVKEPAKEPAKTPPRKDPAHSLDEARTFLDQGSLAEAADDFTAHLKQSPGRYSIQLLIACSDETVKKAVRQVASKELYIVPVSYRGRSCYRLCWGIYDDASQAGAATHTLPEYFRKGGATPKVYPTTGLLP
jgi:septal ring-binding cell division protein DamX